MDDNTIFPGKQNNPTSSSSGTQPTVQTPPIAPSAFTGQREQVVQKPDNSKIFSSEPFINGSNNLPVNKPEEVLESKDSYGQDKNSQGPTGEFVITPSRNQEGEFKQIQENKRIDQLSSRSYPPVSEPKIVKLEEQASSGGMPPSFSPFSIIKAILGVVILIVIAFLLIRFVPSLFTKSKNENVVLTYWGLWEDKGTMQSIINDFQRQNPTIKVSYEKKDVKQYRESLVTRIQNGSGPDIFRFHNTWVPQLANVLLPLSSDTISKEDFKKWFYPVTQADLMRGGAIYGIPLQIDTLALFVNTDALQAADVKPPTTWEDFTKTARILTVKNESGKIQTAGAAMGTFDNITHAPDIISLLLIQNGANIKDLSATSKNASDSLDFYTSFAKGDAIVWDDTLDPSYLAFAKGNLAMYFGYSWDVLTIKAINPQLNFQIVPVPHLQDRSMTIASYWSEGVSVKSKHQKEAMLFMKYISQKDVAQRLYTEEAKKRIFGEPYARVDLADSLKSNALVYPFVSQAKDARSSFFASSTFDNGLNEQMNGYLGNAVRSVIGNTSPQSAVETLAKGVAQVLSRY